MTCLSKVLTFKMLALLVTMLMAWPGGLLAGELGEGQSPAQGQQKPAESQESRRSQYYLHLGTEDALQFYVHVWGQVGKPGLYLVSDGTDVIGLLSLAGGPTEDAKLGRITLVRSVAGRKGAVRIDLKRYTDSGDYSGIPVLEPGDTVVVPSTFWHQVIRFGTILSVTALFANVIVYATR